MSKKKKNRKQTKISQLSKKIFYEQVIKTGTERTLESVDT